MVTAFLGNFKKSTRQAPGISGRALPEFLVGWCFVESTACSAQIDTEHSIFVPTSAKTVENLEVLYNWGESSPLAWP